MKNWARLGVVFVAASVLPACATVVRGTKTTYSVVSTPPGADVAFSTGQACVTPCKMKLSRKEGFTATVTKAGYQAESASVESKISGGGGVAAAGNILVGGIIGGIVDGANGSLNSFFPRALTLVLRPLQAVAGAVATPQLRTQAENTVTVAETRPVGDAYPGMPVLSLSAPVPVDPARATVAAPRALPNLGYSAPQDSAALSAKDRFEQALKAHQTVRGGDPKQGWTISD